MGRKGYYVRTKDRPEPVSGRIFRTRELADTHRILLIFANPLKVRRQAKMIGMRVKSRELYPREREEFARRKRQEFVWN